MEPKAKKRAQKADDDDEDEGEKSPGALGSKKDDDEDQDDVEPDEDAKKRPATRPGLELWWCQHYLKVQVSAVEFPQEQSDLPLL